MPTQDIAAEQSTMAYRAPELFDVKTGIALDEKVDIWVYTTSLAFDNNHYLTHCLTQSLGCTLYALAYLHSPFETLATTEQGGSIAMAVMNAQYKHPSNSAYSQGLRDLIDSMLKSDPAKRPDIHQVRTVNYKLIWNVDESFQFLQVIDQTDSVLRTLV